MERITAMALAKPPFAGIDYDAFFRQLKPQERTIASLALVINTAFVLLESRAATHERHANESDAFSLLAWVETVGPWLDSCETLTLDEFSWVCVRGDPRQPKPFWINDQHRAQEAVLSQLHRCVGASLNPLPASGQIREPRFLVSELIQVVERNRCGPVVLLNIRALVNFNQLKAGRPVPVLSEAFSPVSTGQAPVRSRLPGKRWRDVLLRLLIAIEEGANRSGTPFSRKQLPEGVKQLIPVLADVCAANGLPLPTTQTLRREINRLGWGFSGPGVKKTTGELRRLAKIGRLDIQEVN